MRGWLILGLVAGCALSPLEPVPGRQIRVETHTWPVEVPRQLDLLFVVDDSPAMLGHEDDLRANASNMVGVLSSLEGGLPDLHVAVVTTDLGTHDLATAPVGFGAGTCRGDGDDGDFRGGGFLIDDKLIDGSRLTNFDGSLADAFAARFVAGARGCKYPEPLGAMRRALERPTGFLRDDADLMVMFLTAQDDCTFRSPAFFRDDPEVATGPIRCTLDGITCTDPDHCKPRPSSTYLDDVYQDAAFLKARKQDPSQVIVSVVAGPPTPVVIQGATLEPSCTDRGTALPAVRLNAFVNQFLNRGVFSTICQHDLTGALSPLAELITSPLASSCLEGVLAEPIDCTVSDVEHFGKPDEAEHVLPACDAAASQTPCWRIAIDPMNCVGATGEKIEVARTAFPPRDTTVIAQCAVDAP